MRKITLSVALFLAATIGLNAQVKAPENWFNLDLEQDGVPGLSTERAYKELLRDKPSTTVIVAVIDSGVDPNHEDLKDVMWVNPGEIPGNGIDDDKNGYIDDINGWNFIGGKDGKNVNQDTYEMVRLIKKYKAKFDSKTIDQVAPEDKAMYKEYERAVKEYNDKQSEMGPQYAFIKPMAEAAPDAVALVKKEFGLTEITPDKLATLKSDKKDVKKAIESVKFMTMLGSANDTEFLETLKEYNTYFSDLVEFSLSMDFDPRPIVGDDYENSAQRNYGNNDVYGKGGDCSHGTHVAGIIGANRKNSVGMKGVADNVKIMAVRVVPNGDERDKDVANGIRYAADNGAKIINMSFGKYFGSDKKTVDEAIKYAQSKGVLFIHAAGNDSYNLDNYGAHYPTPQYADGTMAANWVEVGASSWDKGKEGVASFSNYGAKEVDLFSPGVDLYSTYPDGKYKDNSGTSMASPACAGVAALVWSYFPNLTAAQVKEILTKSVVKQKKRKVVLPGSKSMEKKEGKLVRFKALCNTQGIVNAYQAVKMAQKMSN